MLTALSSRLGRWAELTQADRAALNAAPGETLTLARGACPLPFPDPHHRTLVMLDGWAGRCKETAGGKRVIGEFLLPGDVQPHLRHGDKSLRTVMLAAGSVRLIPPAAMADLIGRPTISEALGWAKTVQESINREWLVNIGARKVYARLAHLFCEIAVRMNSAGLLRDGLCPMPLTQADLADALSMTHAHCNIALQRLRTAGLVQVEHKMLTILDMRTLESVAEYDDQYLMRWPTELPDRRGLRKDWRGMDRRLSNRYG